MNKKKGMAIASLVLGVCSPATLISINIFFTGISTVAFSKYYILIPISFGFSMISAVIGAILGVLACKSTEVKQKGFAIVGLVLSITTLIVVGFMWVLGN